VTALLADPVYQRHATGLGHPERPDRLDAVLAGLERAGVMSKALRLAPRAATNAELAACHSERYITTVKHDVSRGYEMLTTGDTNICPESLTVALHAVGGVLNAVDAVVERRAKNAFCAVRPPGHHATPNRGMGFCVFNNVALGARYAQHRYGMERVAIADWDVHHGNGTQDCFYEDGSVFFFSSHQYPWYPGTGASSETGEGAGRGTTLNCPFPAGSGRAEILGAFQHKLLPAMSTFRPDMVFLSAGFDSRLGDPLGRFTLSDQDFADLTALMLEVADRYAGGRLVSVLEGGYDLDGLAAATAAHVSALHGA